MDDPQLWDALRDRGVDADDPEIRAAVRKVFDVVDDVRRRADDHAARRCAKALHAALEHELSHPDTGDMSAFEDEFEDDG